MKVIPTLLLATLLSTVTISAAWCADTLDADTKKNLAKLEQKYFGHSFETDVDDARAARLEHMIFGEENSSGGSAQERIAKILAVSPLEATVPPAPSVDENSADNTAVKTKKKARRTAQQPSDQEQNSQASNRAASPAGGADGGSLSQSDYPHVSALEQVILGQTDEGRPLAERFAKLETKAFGKPSSNPDFSQRTDALDEYSEKTLHIKIVKEEAPDEETTYEAPGGTSTAQGANSSTAAGRGGNNSTGGANTSPQNNSDGETSDYPHITALETAILGETYAGQPISERLGRMEACAFGEVSKVADLSRRTDALDAYTRKTLHKKQVMPEQTDTETADAGGATGRSQNQPARQGMSKKQIFAIAANTLLGAAGFGGANMGLTAAGMGMDAMRAQQEEAQRRQYQQEPEPAGSGEEDPIAFSKVPPPANARMLSKIAWCEAHVFGQTFDTMHLKQRLRQLSQELQFNVQKSDLQLMDDVDGMIKAVLTQVMHSPIGAAPQQSAPKTTATAVGTAPPSAPVGNTPHLTGTKAAVPTVGAAEQPTAVGGSAQGQSGTKTTATSIGSAEQAPTR